MELLGALIVGFFLILFLRGLFGDRSKAIGEAGEKKLRRYLNKLSDDYIVISDLYLPTRNGTTTQVDAIVLSIYGIFVIEAKNYDSRGKGVWIFGDDSSRQWCYCLKGGLKFYFQNPLRQNYMHIAVISELTKIPKYKIHNLIVFTGWAEFKTPMPQNVIYEDELIPYIKKLKTPCFEQSQISTISENIRHYADSVTDEMKKSHIRNLKVIHG